jgi:class 3 adenylate cyclase/CheY-like chemotaxis protein
MNGREALEILRQKPFDLMLLDIQMPEMNGYQVLEAMKGDPALRKVPVIVLSASDETERVAHCIQMGAEDYLPKPFEPVLLQARLGACLEKKQLRDREQMHLRQIEEEQEKSERLLLNVLPPPIAERLKRGEQGIADSFAEVTILFADLVGFSSLAAGVAPAQLVERLNGIFSAFDNAVAALGLEKIKTIGDAYMAVGGLPVPRPDHAEAVAELALRMQEEIQVLNERTGTSTQIRVGINTGPVVAGIIGRRKFSYDLWGEAVNLASRMESHSLPGRIQVAPPVKARLENRYRFEPRGPIEIKGIGSMPTFFLLGRRSG